jgi:4-hydroxythreonine-4-phosphate dehydrogenase
VIEQLPPVKPGLRIAVTMGDPAGIGPEIVAACLVSPTAGVSAFVVGDVDVMRRAVAAHDPNWRVRAISAPADMVALARTVDVLPAGVALPADLPIGKVAASAGRASFDYVARAIDLAQAGAIDAVVTAPINKAAWHAAGITFPGHTELLAERCGIDDFAMMLFNHELKVVLLSIHVPLRRAVDLVTVERELRIIRLADTALRDMGVVRPRVSIRMRAKAVCSGPRITRSSPTRSDKPAPMASTRRGHGPATPYSCGRAAVTSMSSSRSIMTRV